MKNTKIMALLGKPLQMKYTLAADLIVKKKIPPKA